MTFMQWTGMLEIDGATVDEQHRALFETVNAFHDAVALGQTTEAMASTLDVLSEYGRRHFTDEERLLVDAGYPQLYQHRRQHQVFLDQIRSFRLQLIDGGSGLGHSMSQFLGSWLINHIMISDKAYAVFLRSHTPLPMFDASS